MCPPTRDDTLRQTGKVNTQSILSGGPCVQRHANVTNNSHSGSGPAFKYILDVALCHVLCLVAVTSNQRVAGDGVGAVFLFDAF